MKTKSKIIACVAGFIVIAALIGSFFAWFTRYFKSTEVYQQSLAAAVSHPSVIEALGEPIEDGWMPEGTINHGPAASHAHLRIRITGPKGQATVFAVAEKPASRWVFETLTAEIHATGNRIDLHAQEEQNTNKAADATSEPAPGAASSSAQR